MKQLLPILVVLLIQVPISATEVYYEADVLPEQAGWFDNSIPEANGLIVGGIYTVARTSNGCDRYYRTDVDSVATDANGITIETRWKNTPGGYNNSENHVIWARFYYDPTFVNTRVVDIKLKVDDGLVTLTDHIGSPGHIGTYAMDTTDDFHVYRITISLDGSGQRKAKLYIDNYPSPVISIVAWVRSVNPGEPRLAWGNQSSSSAEAYELDYFWFTDEGAFAAEGWCGIGSSLYPIGDLNKDCV